MTREEAYYERIKLLCGDWDSYDAWLNTYLETEDPLSNIVLELLECRDDIKEAEYRLNLYCQEKPFDEESVYVRLRLELYEQYEQGSMNSDDVATMLFRISAIIPFCAFQLACGNISDYYVFVSEGLLNQEEFDLALKEFLREGRPINVNIMWDKLLKPEHKKKTGFIERMKKFFMRLRKENQKDS